MIDDESLEFESLRIIVAQAFRVASTLELLSYLDDKNAIVRTAAARGLHLRGERHVLDLMLQREKDPDPDVREITAFTLAQFGTPEYAFRNDIVPVLVRMCSDSVACVRDTAVSGLGHLSASEAIETIAIASADDDADVRASAAAALRSMGAVFPRAISILEKLLDDEDIDVREWAELSRSILCDDWGDPVPPSLSQ